jgi:ATP-binding cassette subfamily B protein
MTASNAKKSGANPSEKSDSEVLRRLIGEVGPFKATFLGALVLYLPLVGAQLAQPLIIGQAVDEGFKTGDVAAVGRWAGVYLAAVVGHSAFQIAQLALMQLTGLRVVRHMRKRLFGKIQRLPLAFFDRTPLGKTMTRVTNDMESLAEGFSSGSVAIVGDLLFLVGTVVMLIFVDAKLTLSAMALMPILAVGIQFFRVRARRAFKRVRAKLAAINAYLQEYLSGMHVVQLFNRGETIRETFEGENRDYMLANRSAIAIDASIYAFVEAISSITVALVLFVGAGMHEADALTIGILIAFIEALGRFFIPIRELSNKYTLIQSALVAAERVYLLQDEDEERDQVDCTALVDFKRALSFRDVTFGYDPAHPVLSDVSFTVKKGERVALVGHTGAGKSTVIKLATRFYDVKDGGIFIDDTDIRTCALSNLRRLYTVVPQDVFLFSGTLRENLRYGNPDASDADIHDALGLCQATHLLDRPGGLDFEVAQRGGNFSLGERQLLALARALVADPEILILDEATASVDPHTERLLQVATEELLKGRTALVVAHRLSTIQTCDRILVFHKGRLEESGDHATLMAQGGRYAKMVALQSRAGGRAA